MTDVRNDLSGSAGAVVQAGQIYGNIHIQSAPASPVPRQLPPQTAHFTGRHAELSMLAALAEHSGAIVVTGAGGVGKTALTLQWAHAARDRFADGDLYLNLHGYDDERAMTPEQALARLIQSLEPPSAQIPSDLDSLTSRYRSLLAGRRILVVLDNAATAAQVRPLLPGSDTCQVVVSSRSRLAALSIHDGAQLLALGILPPDEAVELLEHIIGTETAASSPGALAELARLCGFLPLALRIAAYRVVMHDTVAARSRALSTLLPELASEQDRLDTLAVDDVDGSTAIRAVFALSYQRLAADHARVFRRLCLHTGARIGESAVAALLGGPVGVRRGLDALVAVHMVSEHCGGEPWPDRYFHCHDLVRLYANERCSVDESQDERAGALDRLLGWYLHTAEAADRMLIPQRRRVAPDPVGPGVTPMDFATRDEAWQWCMAELDNLVPITRLAADSGHVAIAWQLPRAMSGFFTLHRPWAQWMETHEIALTAARSADDLDGQAWLLRSLGLVHADHRRYPTALGYLSESLDLRRRTGDLLGEGITLTDLGNAYACTGQTESALESYGAALEIYRRTGDLSGEASTLNYLGKTQRTLDPAASIANHEWALALYRSVGHQWGEATALHLLGGTLGAAGRRAEAVVLVQTSLAIRREIGDRQGEGRSLNALAVLYAESGQVAMAGECWSAALVIFDGLGDPRSADVRSRLASLATEVDKPGPVD